MSDVAAIEKICPQCGRTYGAESVFCAADGASLRPIQGNADLVGNVIADRYLVLDKLGEGGMGRVYRARHVRLPQEVAIKVLSPKLVNDPDSIARFNREAANASQISSEQVARVFDFGETGDGLVYLAMEFVPGRTLRAVLEAEGPLQPHRAAALVWQIAEGLDAAHRRGIVHRDLKPENVIVFVDTDGSERLKVVDFGIAKALADASGTGRMTRTGLVIGTPEYMSPEQITGDPVDARSDVYALALVAYVLLTGRQPFDARTPEAAMTARLLRDPRPLTELLPSVAWPAAMQGVLDRGLARDPAARYATAGEFAGALADAVDDWLAPEEAARTGVMTRPPAAGRRPFATPARPTTAMAGGTAPVSRPLSPTGYGPAMADDLGGSTATSPTQPRQTPATAASVEPTTLATGAAATPAASSTTGPTAGAGGAAAVAPSLSATLVGAAAAGAPPRDQGTAGAAAGGNQSNAAGAMPTPAGGGGRPRALVIAGAVAAFAALATAALVTFRPWESSPAAADSAVAPPASQGSEPGGGAPAAGGGAPAGGNTQPGTAGNTGNAGTGGAGGTPASPDSAAAGSGPNAGERPLDAAAAGRALDALDVALHPDSTTPAVARQSLRTLNALMPRLPTAGDSVRADILRFQAYVQSEQIRRGCALLNSVRRRPLTENQRAVVRLYTQQICQAGGGG